MPKFDMEKCNLKWLNIVAVKEHHHVKISNRFIGFKNIHDYVDISRVWETIWKNIRALTRESLHHYKLKHYKP
jgi:hypothetical protein